MLINVYANAGQGTGYTGMADNLIVAMEDVGFDVRLVGYKSTLVKNMSERARHVLNKPFRVADIGLCIGFPSVFPKMNNKIKIGYTMFETDKLPSGKGYGKDINTWTGETGQCKDVINPLNLLLVPCKHNEIAFRSAGVTSPIEVVNLGVRADLFPDLSKQREQTRQDRPFTFLLLGTLTLRKNPAAAMIAFMNNFKDKNAQLVLKSNSGTIAAMKFPDNVNIKVIDEYSTHLQILQHYHNADAFVFPSRGEGFGLTPLEAMATGLPTIVSDNTGMSEYCNDDYNLPLADQKTIPAFGFPKKWGDVGNWYEPNIAELGDKMLYLFNNQQKAIELGKKASIWVHQNYTYKHSAQKILNIIKKWTI